MTISRAGKMPRLARVLKKASLFCGCNVCENAQNSLTKFTWRENVVEVVEQSLNIMMDQQTEKLLEQ